VDLEARFERDLRRWLALIYERMEFQARHEEWVSVEGVLERENRFLTVLIVILGLSVMLLPFVGGTAMMIALLLLYAGALGSSVVTLLKIRRLEQSAARSQAIRERHENAWRARPFISPDDRAQLIRIMNLSNLARSSSVTVALANELAEARGSPGLASWPALLDAEVLIREVPPAPKL
jgi:hypothetical protein